MNKQLTLLPKTFNDALGLFYGSRGYSLAMLWRRAPLVLAAEQIKAGLRWGKYSLVYFDRDGRLGLARVSEKELEGQTGIAFDALPKFKMDRKELLTLALVSPASLWAYSLVGLNLLVTRPHPLSVMGCLLLSLLFHRLIVARWAWKKYDFIARTDEISYFIVLTALIPFLWK